MSQQTIVPHPRGLPSVLFIEDEEAFLAKTGLSEEEAALEMRAAFQQLRQLSEALALRREGLLQKIPDTEKNLATLRLLKLRNEEQKDTVMQFELIGGVYAKAKVPPTGKVALWMGANVMLEYTLDEAEAFLTQTAKSAQESLDHVIADLRHLDDQKNTLEVNINRMHNHSLNKRRRMREQQMAQQMAAALQQQQQQQQLQK